MSDEDGADGKRHEVAKKKIFLMRIGMILLTSERIMWPFHAGHSFLATAVTEGRKPKTITTDLC